MSENIQTFIAIKKQILSKETYIILLVLMWRILHTEVQIYKCPGIRIFLEELLVDNSL